MTSSLILAIEGMATSPLSFLPSHKASNSPLNCSVKIDPGISWRKRRKDVIVSQDG